LNREIEIPGVYMNSMHMKFRGLKGGCGFTNNIVLFSTFHETSAEEYLQHTIHPVAVTRNRTLKESTMRGAESSCFIPDTLSTTLLILR
jgi:hypothetical protein